MDFFYPQEERHLFTNRQLELGLLGLSVTSLRHFRRQNIALVGFRRIGKTLILREFLKRQLEGGHDDVFCTYIDLKRIGFSPEYFAAQYVGSVLYWLLEKGKSRIEPYYDPAFQLAAAARLNNPEVQTYLFEFNQELARERPNHRILLEKAFNFPETISQALNLKGIVIIDEFQELVVLDRFSQVGNVLDLFRSILQNQSFISYVVAGSAIRMMERIFHSSESPLFVHFRTERIGFFSEEDSTELAGKVLAGLDRQIPAEVYRTIYQWTFGHPFYITAVCSRIIELAALHGKEIGPDIVKQSFVLEALTLDGRIYNLCQYILRESLERARGDSMLQLVLQVMARHETGMTLSQVARQIRRKTGPTRNLLRWLIDADLIIQDGNTYRFRDPALKAWLAFYYEGKEFTALPRQETLAELVRQMAERYLRASSELGLAKESQPQGGKLVMEPIREKSGYGRKV